MKSFFIALILGIFIGSIATNYFSDPEGYQKLQAAKELMLTTPDQTPAEEPLPETEPTPPTAMFQVGGKEFQPEANPNNPAPTIEAPAPTIAEPPAPTKTTEPASPTPAPEPSIPAPAKSQTRAEELLEQGTHKAEELAETVKEKAQEIAEQSKPYLETGIDLTIATAIRAQYKLETRIDSAALSIRVKNRTVTLAGAVADEKTKQLAIEIAVFTKGVIAVEETLAVAP